MINPHDLHREYQATMFLTIYQASEPNEYGTPENERTNAPHFYIESHPAIQKDDRIIPGAGRPLSIDSIRNMAKYFADLNMQTHAPLNFKTFLPENVLHAGNYGEDYKVIWHCKPSKRRLYFHENLNIPEGDAHVPGLLFIGKKNSLQVFAVKDKKVSPKSQLYLAPFYNIYNNGNLCLGNIKRPDKPLFFEDVIAEWEQSFFNSYFTHLNISSSPVEGNINLVWKELLQTNKEFPIGILKEHPSKISELLEL